MSDRIKLQTKSQRQLPRWARYGILLVGTLLILVSVAKISNAIFAESSSFQEVVIAQSSEIASTDTPLPDDLANTMITIAEVEIIGVEGDLQDLVYRQIGIQPGQTLTVSQLRIQLQRDQEKIFHTGWFSSCLIITENVESGIRIIFEVEPFILEQVRIISLPEAEISDIFPQEIVDDLFAKWYGKIVNAWQFAYDPIFNNLAISGSESYSRFFLDRVEQDFGVDREDILGAQAKIRDLEKWYQDNGYLARIVRSDFPEDGNFVDLYVSEGIIEDIRIQFLDEDENLIQGESSEAEILRGIRTEIGQIAQLEIMQSDRQRLLESGIFWKVDYEPNYNFQTHQVILTLKLSEWSSLNPGRRAFEEGRIAHQQGGTESSLMQALDLFQEALDYYRLSGDQYRQAFILNEISLVYNSGFLPSLDNPEQSLIYSTQALELIESIQDNSEIEKIQVKKAAILDSIAASYAALGEYQAALNSYFSALQTISNLEPSNEINIQRAFLLHNSADVYRRLNDLDRAIYRITQSITLLQKITPQFDASLKGIVGGYALRGDIYRQIGNTEQAKADYQLALEWTERLAYPFLLRTGIFIGISQIYVDEDNKQQALYFANEAVKAAQETEDRRDDTVALSSLAIIQIQFESFAEAVSLLEQALEILQVNPNISQEIQVLKLVGFGYYFLDDFPASLRAFNQAIELAETISELEQEAELRSYIAGIEGRQGNLLAALDQINQAIQITESLRVNVASVDLRTSFFGEKSGYYAESIQILMQLAQEDSNAETQREYEISAFNASERSRSRTFNELLVEAKVDLSRGIDDLTTRELLQEERALISQLEAQRNLLSQQLSTTQGTERTTIRENYNQQVSALEIQLEQVQSQIRQAYPDYADIQYRPPLTLEEIQQEVLDEETILLQYFVGEQHSYLWVVPQQGKLQSYTLPGRENLEGEDGFASGFISAVQTRECEWQLQQECIPFGVISSGRALLEQILPPDAFNQLQGKRLLIVADDILQYVPFAALPDPNVSGAEDYVPLIVSHEIVMAPSASSIALLREQVQHQEQTQQRPPSKTLATIADPVFNCSDPRAPRVCRTTLTSPSVRTETATTHVEAVPSLETISLQLEQSAQDRALQVTDTSLTGLTRLNLTAETANHILETIPNSQRVHRVGLEANQNWMMGINPGSSQNPVTETPLRPYRYILLATHGIFNSQNPELSGLVLSQMDETGQPVDGFLRLNEIFNLKLSADLVVLSACRSGLSENVRGEGLIGLTRGFMFAGAKRIMPTLWDISAEQPTDELLTSFFNQILREENPVSLTAALQQTQIELWERYHDPYYWAAFTIQGEWQE